MPTSSKSVIITGGASGIGLGMVNHFASQEANLHITILDVTTASFPALESSLSTTYPNTKFSFLTCDVSSWDSISSCFSRVYSQQGRIDIVMANAGISKEGKLIDDDQDAEPSKPNLGTIDVNLTGCIYTVKLAVHYMRRNALASETSASTNRAANGTSPSPRFRGQIIATASNAGVYAFPVAPVYAATKAGVNNLVRSLAPTLAHPDCSIQINALAPAVLETNIAPDKALFKGMILTPMSTLCRGVDVLLEPGRTGDVAEIHGEKVTVREVYGWVDEDSRKNIEHFTSLGYA